MRIGIGLPNQVRDVRPTVIPRWAALAEQAGFSSLGSVGRIAYPGVMDTVALAGAAGPTSTIGLLSAIADANAGRANVYDYYSNFGDETANMITGGLRGTEDTILKAVKAFQDLGADELIFNPSVDDLDEVSRLADLVL